MKTFFLIVVSFIAQPALADSAESQVNYHLRKMQTEMDAEASRARVNALQAESMQMRNQEVDLRNDPTYGLGDENVRPVIGDELTTEAEPSHLTAEETVRLELERRRMTNVSAMGAEENTANENFIKEFKQRAAAKGVRLEVDPETYEVRKAR